MINMQQLYFESSLLQSAHDEEYNSTQDDSCLRQEDSTTEMCDNSSTSAEFKEHISLNIPDVDSLHRSASEVNVILCSYRVRLKN